MVLVVDGTEDRHVIHNPAFCLMGAGKEIASERDLPLSRGNGSILSISSETSFQELAFWYTNGKSRYTSFMN